VDSSIAREAEFVCNAPMASDKKYDISVTVRTQFLPEQSDTERGPFVFAYFITIRNTGGIAAQLISRHWIITDAEGRSQEVKGLGVVGQQPLLKPGEEYQYQSGTPLNTPVGTMRGSYQMVAEDGTHFDAAVPEFVLSMPRTLH
jgi:ApaG protein